MGARSNQVKQDNLKQAVQGFKLVKLRKNLTEIASVASISERTVQNHRKKIDECWSEESTTPGEDKKFILERGIEVGIDEVLKSAEPTPEQIFGVILGSYLKVETDLLGEAESLKKVWTIGQYITHIHGMVCRYKNKSVPIHSDDNPYAKYLLQSRNMNKPNLDKLFLRSDDYLIGKCSKRWLSTELLKKYIEISSDKLFNIISNPITEEPAHPSSPLSIPHMLRQNGAIQASGKNGTKFFITVDYNNIYTILVAKINIIEQFEPNSKFSLIAQAVKITKDEIHIPIKHKAKGAEYLGRTYNVFCGLRSHERLKLGYIGYDMSAAMQSISLQLIKAKRDDYPMLWDYANDKAYKKQIRTEIAQTLGIEVEEVKFRLTAFANGSVAEKNRHSHYKIFQEESDRLRRAVLKYVNDNEPNILKRAKEQSRKAKDLPNELDWSDTDSKETLAEMRSKSSVFFFVWTWYERQIRQAMLDVLEDGIEVHDAVYSKMDIDPELVEQAIFGQTGFSIIVDKEKPEI